MDADRSYMYLWCSFDRAEPVLQRGLPTREGLLTCGERGRIASSSLPNPAWIALEDLNRPFRCVWFHLPPSSVEQHKSCPPQCELEPLNDLQIASDNPRNLR